MQKADIFQAYADSNGPDQPANMGSPIKVYLHEVFKQCKVVSLWTQYYTGQIMREYMLKLKLCCPNMITNFEMGQIK